LTAGTLSSDKAAGV